MSELPLNNPVTKRKSWCNYADFSVPAFQLTSAFGGIGTITNLVEGETFDTTLSIAMTIASLLAWWRVQKLGEAQSIMESVTDLEENNRTLQEENDELKESNDQLNALEKRLENDLKSLKGIMSIVDTRNKSAEEIKNEMIKIYENLKKENEKYTKLNKVNTFLTADTNNDGVISGYEKEILQTIDINGKNYDYNNDGSVSMSEYLKPDEESF